MQTVSILLKSLKLLGGFALALLQAQGPKTVISHTPRLTFVQPQWQIIHSPDYVERVEERSPD